MKELKWKNVLVWDENKKARMRRAVSKTLVESFRA